MSKRKVKQPTLKSQKPNYKDGDKVSKLIFDRALKRINFWEDNGFDANNLPPGYSVQDYKDELQESHQIVRNYLDQ